MMEGCIKFDELAEYVIEQGMAREVTKAEARELIRKCQEDNLVHFVDNAIGDVKHNCNCCGCCCWSLSKIRKRALPRDSFMATYFMRKTDEDQCTGCGDCLEVCPVDCLEERGDVVVVDEEWCIGCGVCVPNCPSQAVSIELRQDKLDEQPAATWKELHEQVLASRTRR
jgi:NAD-dependent dihydropyrimidine dehydrogenase PreA subunit